MKLTKGFLLFQLVHPRSRAITWRQKKLMGNARILRLRRRSLRVEELMRNRTSVGFYTEGNAMSSVYRSRRLPAFFIIPAGMLFVSFGVFGIFVNGLESAWFFGMFALLGFVVGILGGIAHLSICVSVDERGIIQRNMYRTDFAFSWDEVEFWRVGPVGRNDERGDDSFTFQKVEFKLRDRGSPIIVYDCDVWRPGFDQFVENVRRSLPIKEKTS